MAKKNKPPKPALRTEKHKTPPRNDVEEHKIQFCLKFWKQIDLFGLSNCNRFWFVSLLERFRDIEKLTPDELMTNGRRGIKNANTSRPSLKNQGSD